LRGSKAGTNTNKPMPESVLARRYSDFAPEKLREVYTKA